MTNYLRGQCQLAAMGTLVAYLTLQDVQADAAKSINVGVVDLGQEANLGWCHGVVVREEELKLEDAT